MGDEKSSESGEMEVDQRRVREMERPRLTKLVQLHHQQMMLLPWVPLDIHLLWRGRGLVRQRGDEVRAGDELGRGLDDAEVDDGLEAGGREMDRGGEGAGFGACEEGGPEGVGRRRRRRNVVDEEELADPGATRSTFGGVVEDAGGRVEVERPCVGETRAQGHEGGGGVSNRSARLQYARPRKERDSQSDCFLMKIDRYMYGSPNRWNPLATRRMASACACGSDGWTTLGVAEGVSNAKWMILSRISGG